MSYQEVAEGQVSPEVPINENMAALGQGFVFSHDVTTDSGLVVGINGGPFDGNTVADTTVTCTDDDTNYVVAHRTTLAVSTSTATTNWNNITTYGRVGRAVFADGVLTWHDERSSVGGIFDHAAAGVVSVAAEDVTIADAGGHFTGTDVEAALQELGASIGLAPAAEDVTVADVGGYFTAADVEAVLQEVGADLASQPFDVLAFYPGIPTASAKVCRVPIARAVTFPANFAGSYFTASANATGTTVFDVQKNGSSIGSVSIAAGGTTATFTTTSGTSKSFAAGDVLALIAPGTPDATLADVGFALAGTR